MTPISNPPEPLAFLNGRLIPGAQAAVRADDTGFVLGATVTERLRTFAGRLFRLEEHLARLRRSLEIVGIDVAVDDLASVAEELVVHNHALLDDGDDLGLVLFITPGPVATLASAEPAGPTVCLHTHPLPFGLWADKYESGQALATTSVRQVPTECWPPELKCRSRMHYYLADREAGKSQPDAWAVMQDERGFLTETSSANLIVAKDGRLQAPPPQSVLPGVSLAVVEELAMELEIPFTHQEISLTEAAAADEVLLTSTPWCLLPVGSLDGRPIDDGRPGELYRRLRAGWNEMVGFDLVEQAKRFGRR